MAVRTAYCVHLPTVSGTLCCIDLTYLTLDPQHMFGKGEIVEDKIHGYCGDQELA